MLLLHQVMMLVQEEKNMMLQLSMTARGSLRCFQTDKTSSAGDTAVGAKDDKSSAGDTAVDEKIRKLLPVIPQLMKRI